MDGVIGHVESGQEKTAHKRRRNVEDVTDIAHNRHENIRKAVSGGGVGTKLTVQRVEILDGLVLVTEDLNNLLSVHHLLNKALDLTKRLLLTDKEPCTVTAHHLCRQEHKEDADHNDHGHPYTVIQHYTNERGKYQSR